MKVFSVLTYFIVTDQLVKKSFKDVLGDIKKEEIILFS